MKRKSMSPGKKPTKRQYPPIYEKFVPIALVVIGIAILALLTITILVMLGVFPGSSSLFLV